MTNQINISYDEIKLEVEFDYQPAEPQTRDYPGCAEEIDLIQVMHENTDILPMLSEDAIEKIGAAIRKVAERDVDAFDRFCRFCWVTA